jgi:TRAP-type C4-dicarboxylate transport system permease small subunit
MFGERTIERTVTAVELCAAAFLAGVTVLTFVSVVMRYLFVAPIPDDFDLTRLLLGVAIFWGIACACWRGGHIQVDLLWNALPRRGRSAMDLFAMTLSLAFMVVFAWTVFGRVVATQATGMTTMDLRIPVWPFFALASLGLGFAVLLIPAYLYRVLTRRE